MKILEYALVRVPPVFIVILTSMITEGLSLADYMSIVIFYYLALIDFKLLKHDKYSLRGLTEEK